MKDDMIFDDPEPIVPSQEHIEMDVEDTLKAIHEEAATPEVEKMYLITFWRQLALHPVIVDYLKASQDQYIPAYVIDEDKPVHRGLLSKMRQAPQVTNVVRHEEIQTKRLDVHQGLLSRRKK